MMRSGKILKDSWINHPPLNENEFVPLSLASTQVHFHVDYGPTAIVGGQKLFKFLELRLVLQRQLLLRRLCKDDRLVALGIYDDLTAFQLEDNVVGGWWKDSGLSAIARGRLMALAP